MVLCCHGYQALDDKNSFQLEMNKFKQIVVINIMPQVLVIEFNLHWTQNILLIVIQFNRCEIIDKMIQ